MQTLPYLYFEIEGKVNCTAESHNTIHLQFSVVMKCYFKFSVNEIMVVSKQSIIVLSVAQITIIESSSIASIALKQHINFR